MAADLSQRVSITRRDDELGRWMVATCVPCAALAPFVATYWYGEGEVFYQRDRILPGLSSYLLINLGPTQYRIEPGPPERRIPFRDVWYSGLHQTPIETEAPHGNALLGVAFHAAGARPILGADAGELADRITPLTDLLGDFSARLRGALLELDDPLQRFALIEGWLLARLDRRRTPHRLVQWALTRMAESEGQVAVEVLARDAGVSRKHLGDLFRRDVGHNPKSLMRLLRFQSALKLLSNRHDVPWVELAALCGYYDQSHLTRDFQAFSGFAPGAFVRQARPDGGSVVVT